MRVIALAWLLFILALVWGQLLNIVDLATGWATMATNELVIRGLGLIVLPLGAYLGWF